jgi:hypothetical protein
MCSCLLHLAKTVVLTTQKCCSTCCGLHPLCLLAQTRGHKIMDNDDISIYMSEELERLESLRVWEFVHTHVYGVNLLKKGGWMSTFPLSFVMLVGVLWWDFREVHYWWRGSGRWSTWWRDRDALRWCCVPPSTYRTTSSTTSSVTMASNLMPKSCKDLSLGSSQGAQVWVVALFVLFPIFLVISSLMLLSTSSLPLAYIQVVIIFS